MNVSTTIPPIYTLLAQRLGVNWDDGILITMGDTIHCKDRRLIRDDLLVHEKCHEIQQKNEGGPAVWWKRWLDEPDFRLKQESEAYLCQARWLKEHVKDRNVRARFLFSMSRDLSSSLYGNLISQSDAYKMLTKLG